MARRVKNIAFAVVVVALLAYFILNVSLSALPSHPKATPSTSPKPTPTKTVNPDAMPVGNEPGWTQILTQDFTKNAPLGDFAKVYGSKFAGYSNVPDHASKGTGIYAPDKVLSVENGILNYNLYSNGKNAYVAAALPTGLKGQTYGKYSFRFRADYTPGYREAFLLWPDSGKWAGNGEIDMAETRLDTKNVMFFSHSITGDPSQNAFAWQPGKDVTKWHTVSVEWTPTKITYTIDGLTTSLTDPRGIPKDSMHWVMQVQTLAANKVPAKNVKGRVQVDWITEYKYTPGSK